jgi:hypothetical protein
MFNVYKNQQSRQTGSRNLTFYNIIWSLSWTYNSLLCLLITVEPAHVVTSIKQSLVLKGHLFLYPRSPKGYVCSMCIKINKVGKQEVGIWRVQKRYPQYGIPIWRLWPNIRFLPSTVMIFVMNIQLSSVFVNYSWTCPCSHLY